jgi:2-methylcitrate dehydratase
MSDRYTRILSEYAASIAFPGLPWETVHEVKRRLLDTIGVALAAFHEEAPAAARAYAYEFPSRRGATLWGTACQTTPDIAAFVNGVMARYLDFNDAYISREPLHPSDAIAPLIAVAEYKHRAPTELITAVALSYEIGTSLCDAATLRSQGWDHVNYIGIMTAAAVGRLLDLSVEQMEHAIAMTVVPHAAMRQTRSGELSMWKGAAAANAGRNAVFAALLAANGMTGPFKPFTGEMGFFRQLLGAEQFDEEALAPLAQKRAIRRITDTHIKFWPVEGNTLGAVDAALKLSHEIGDPAKIDSVHIATFQTAYEITAKDPEKWEPKTRETADHSLPYLVAVALLDGQISEESFSPRRIGDPRVHSLIKRTEVKVDPELTRCFPKEGFPGRVLVRTTDGAELVREVHAPRGHARNPMTDDEVVEKFQSNVDGILAPERGQELVAFIMDLERQATLGELVRLMGVRDEQDPG